MKKFLMLLLFPALCFSVAGQNILTDQHISQDIDYARLRRIDTLVNQYIQKGWVKNVVTLIVKDNRLVQYKGYGYSDASGKKPMPQDALFRLASQTKAVVSVAAMTLYEEGKFTLDEPISDFIPEFTHPQVLDQFNERDSSYTSRPATRDITFRDLFTHTSGLDYPGIGSSSMKAIYAKANIPSGLGVVDADLLETMKRLAKLPLAHNPGEKWTYGLSVDLLGCLVEVISGTNLEDYLSQKIFKPLGMQDTYFNVPSSKGSRLAPVYAENAAGQISLWGKTKTGLDPEYPLVKKRYFSGGAGLTATTYDYAIFLQMLLNKGTYNGVEVLAPRTVELMTSGQLDFTYNGVDNFGLGFDITSEKAAARDGRNAGTFSWGGFFGTTYWADPKAKLICLIMTQQVPNSHGDLAKKFEQLVYQSLK
ncbi:MAG: serine hydrolase domain-containing protein [Chitinophagales bacterium]